MIGTDRKLSGSTKASFDLLEPATINDVLLFLPMIFVLLLLLIENWRVVWIGIVNSSNAMTPSCFHGSISLAKQDLILLKIVELAKLLFNFFDFFP